MRRIAPEPHGCAARGTRPVVDIFTPEEAESMDDEVMDGRTPQPQQQEGGVHATPTTDEEIA